MRRAATALAVLCLLVISAAGVTVRPVAAEVDLASLDPDALYAALTRAPLDGIELPGTLTAEDADVSGYGASYPGAGSVSAIWSDGDVYFNYQVFYTVESAAGLYSSGIAGLGDGAADIASDDGVVGGCATRDAGGSEVESCWGLAGNVLIGAGAPAELGIGPDLVRTAAAHLDDVAALVAAEGEAAPGTSAADRATASAQVAASLKEGTASTVEPSELVAALAEAEMSPVELPGFMDAGDAEVEPVAAGADESGTSIGGVTIAWSGMDEGTIGILVYADEAAAGEAYAARQAAVEAELGVLPTFQTVDGLEGFCDAEVFSDSTDPETCFLLTDDVIVTGAAEASSSDATSLANVGAMHLGYVVLSISGGGAATAGTPVAEATDPQGAEALIAALGEAEIGPGVELPTYLPAASATIGALGPEDLGGDQVGGVTVTWASTDPDAFLDGLIYVYVYETDEAAAAAFAGDGEEVEPGDEPRKFSVKANTASGSVEGQCIPVDEDEDGVADYDLCAAVSGNVLVVAADLTEANDGEALAAAAVEHVEAVRGG